MLSYQFKKQEDVFERCMKCTLCTAYCPVSKAFYYYPGPKMLGPDGERFRRRNPLFLDNHILYCTNCKTCESVCPSEVNIAELIQAARWEIYRKSPPSFRDWFLSHTDFVGFFATKISFIVNFFVKIKILRWVMEKILGIARKPKFPKYEQGSFRGFWKKNYEKKYQPRESSDEILFFHGCYINYLNHNLGKDFLTILKKNNITAQVPKQKCCGVPLVANGNQKGSLKVARFNLESFNQADPDAKKDIIITSSSCYRAFESEYPGLLKLDTSEISGRIFYVTRWLLELYEKGKLNTEDLKPVNLTVLYHAPCHLRTKGDYLYSLELLSIIPDLKVIELDHNCCGIAGTYGFKKEKYEISGSIGNVLFKEINAYPAEYVVSDCETCKMQIEMHTDKTVLHPISLLAMSYRR